MKKGNFSVCILVGFILYATNFACNSIEKTMQYPSLLSRTDTNGTSSEFATMNALYNQCISALAKDSNDDLSKLKLVELYISEARITGNNSYYNEASLNLLNAILCKSELTNDIAYKAMAYKATVLLSLHQFNDAKEVALKALKLNPYDADIYGALVDAHVELGRYKEAATFCDQMIGLRPDIRSYSRIAYIRQIYGDLPGAKAAMRLAVESGAQGMENTEWARVQLGDLYLNTGDIDTARMLYESSLYARPSYAYAAMGMAKVNAAAKNYDSAIIHCQRAIRIISESSFVSYLGELYALKGDSQKANEIHSDVLSLILEAETDNQKANSAKHNGNRELAMAYLHTNNLKEAFTYAKNDLELRPNNIDANELLAWILFLQKDKTQAKVYMDMALETNYSNLINIQHAAQIYELAGDSLKAAKYNKLYLAIHEKQFIGKTTINNLANKIQ